MSAADPIAALAAATDARADMIAGLHDLADFLDDNPAIPLPHAWAIAWAHGGKDDAANFKAACEVMLPLGGVVADKRHTDKELAVKLSFGPVELAVEVQKDKIGEKRTTTREVTEYVLPEWAQASEVPA